MVNYECKICNKIFDRKSNYLSHTNRKISCDKQIVKNKSNECKHCKKLFSSSKSMYRHVKSGACKNNNDSIVNIEKINSDINVNIDNSTNNTNTNNTQNNMNVDGDVKLVKFGNENLSYISDDIFKSILGRGFKSVEELVDHSHFHPDHPENHNIYIANIKNDYVVIYDGKKWNINKKEDVFEDIIYAKSDFLCMKFKELMGQMTPMDVKKFTNFINERDEDKTMNKIKGELKLQLYNNRDLPQKLRKQLENQEREKQKRLGNKPRKNVKKLDKIMHMLENIDENELDKMEKLLNKVFT